MTERQPNELERRIDAILRDHGASREGIGDMIRRMIRSRARTMPDAETDDRVQAVWLGLLRVARTGERIENLEALCTTMAKRQAFNWLRLQRSRPEEAIDDAFPLAAPDAVANVDAALLLATIREFLLGASSPCVTVLDLLREGYDLREIAERLQQGHAAVRQRWTRCMALVRDTFRADGGSLADWARDAM